MRTASSPALRAAPTATVATGTPAGRSPRWGQQRVEPVQVLERHGHADDRQRGDRGQHAGQVRRAAGAGDDHPQAASGGAARTRSSRAACGARTPRRTSYGTPNSSSAVAAACMVGQSESLPMTTPTSGRSALRSTVAEYRRSHRAACARAHPQLPVTAPSTVTWPILRPGRTVCRRGGPSRRGRPRSGGVAVRAQVRVGPPSTFAITTAGRWLRSPSGRSSTARRCCSNCDVRAPSMVQWPVLCGRIASSLTRSPGRVSNSSTASTPITPDGRDGGPALGGHRHAASSSGAGASTSAHMPSRCTVCTTGR